jgi:hypothetical protein
MAKKKLVKGLRSVTVFYRVLAYNSFVLSALRISSASPSVAQKGLFPRAAKRQNSLTKHWSSRRNIALSFRHALCSLCLFSFD